MATVGTPEFKASDLFKGGKMEFEPILMEVKLQWDWRFRLRWWLAMRFIKVGAWIMRFDVVTTRTAGTYTVGDTENGG